MSLWDKLKNKTITIPLFKITFSTGGKKARVKTVKIPIYHSAKELAERIKADEKKEKGM